MNVTVFGRLLASFFDTQAAPVPVTGRVLFTPNFTSEKTGEGVHLPTRLSVELDGEGSFKVSLLTGDWSWRVEVIAKDQTGRTLTVPCFNFLPEPGVDRVNFAEIVPVADPVTGEPMLRGEDGVGVDAITTAGGELIFTLTDGSETRIPVPQGIPGTGVEGITLQGDDLVFMLTDGSETRLPAPKGTPGVAGVGISAITLVDGELVFVLTDGAESRLPAPKGEDGSPGKDGAPGADAPAPSLAIGSVVAGATAAATITGTSPDFTLGLTLPKGDKGEPGKDGAPGKDGVTTTVTRTEITASTVGMVDGDGQPEGRVTAPVGTIYVDRLATAGAIRWIKTTGTGNTGWKVEYGDTGWRAITTPTLASGTMNFRRIGDTVFAQMGTGQYRLSRLAEGAAPASEVTPRMFMPQGTEVLGMRIDASNLSVGVVEIQNQGTIVNRPNTGFNYALPVQVSTISYPARYEWGPTLPGTPA